MPCATVSLWNFGIVGESKGDDSGTLLVWDFIRGTFKVGEGQDWEICGCGDAFENKDLYLIDLV